MIRRKASRGPSRAQLVDLKHRLEGEINVLAAELKRQRARGESTDAVEARLDRLRSRHYQTRLQIDRTDPSP